MTRSDHVSGSDRIFEASGSVGAAATADIVVMCRATCRRSLPATSGGAGAARRSRGRYCDHCRRDHRKPEERTNPNVVKVVGTPVGASRLRALYFTRATAPYGEGRSITISGFMRIVARRWNASSRCRPQLERREKLEQLRALEAGMRIDVALVGSVPLGVDTPQDLARARALLA